MTPSLFERAIGSLVPVALYSNEDNTYDGLVWRDDRPKPAREDVDAEIARLEAALARITVERLYFMLEVEEEPGLADAIEALIEQMAEAGNRKPRIYWRDAKVFESDHPLMLQLGQHPSIGKDAAAIRRMCEVAYAKQLAGAA